jgi:hypothetical protein
MLLSTECRVKGRRVSQNWLIKVTVRQRSQIYRTSIPLNAGYIWLHMLTYGYIWLQYIIFLLDPKGWGPVISWFQTPSKYSYSNLLVSNPISFPTRGANYSGPPSISPSGVCLLQRHWVHLGGAGLQREARPRSAEPSSCGPVAPNLAIL